MTSGDRKILAHYLSARKLLGVNDAIRHSADMAGVSYGVALKALCFAPDRLTRYEPKDG